ncbi:hypothetical protein HAX54_033461, partial [Datura stramonium]|nr:hypothetical protein [Datura stramonium]
MYKPNYHESWYDSWCQGTTHTENTLQSFGKLLSHLEVTPDTTIRGMSPQYV